MRRLTYLAVFETGKTTGISVYFPDVPGCVFCGDDFDHALQMSKEALALHIYGMEKDGESPPLRTDKIPETRAGDMIVPVSIYPRPPLLNRAVKNKRHREYMTKSGIKTHRTAYRADKSIYKQDREQPRQ
jgi:predicted RNase H-like HicB family nuclease